MSATIGISSRALSLSLSLICSMLLTGCPNGQPSLNISENIHDFRSDHTQWTFFVFNGGSPGTIACFEPLPHVPWASVRAARPFSLGPKDYVPVTVSIDRNLLPGGDTSGRVSIGNGESALEIEILATNGDEDYVRLVDYFPLEVGNSWTYAQTPSKLSGVRGQAVPVSRITVIDSFEIFGIPVWKARYEDFEDSTVSDVFLLYMDGRLWSTGETGALSHLPDSDAFHDAVWPSGDKFNTLTRWWLRGFFEPGLETMYTNTTVYTTASLETIAPFIHSGTNHDHDAGDFLVPGTTECLGLAFQNFGVGQTSYFELYAKDVGPLLEPFDKDALLTEFELVIR